MIGRDTFSALAPVLGPQQKKLASSMSPSCTVHGGQHDTKHVAFEFLLHAAFVADEIRGNMLEPAHIGTGIVSVYPDNRVRCTVVPLYALQYPVPSTKYGVFVLYTKPFLLLVDISTPSVRADPVLVPVGQLVRLNAGSCCELWWWAVGYRL